MSRIFRKKSAGSGFARPALFAAQRAALLLAVALLFAIPCAAEEPITVCVLDSGCNLAGAEGWNYIDDSSDLADGPGHGTRIYTLLAACAPDARVVMLKCFDSEASFDGAAAVRALYAAVDDYGADVINMSWTVNGEDEGLRAAAAYAAEKGAVLVASAGNLSFVTGIGETVYPAAWDDVIGVGGVDLDAAGNPASSLWYLSGPAVYVCADGAYEGERGSSYAAARVAGLVAAYLADLPGPDPDAREMLRCVAEDIGAPGYDTVYGWGYVKSRE